jgi:hypothetical protein
MGIGGGILQVFGWEGLGWPEAIVIIEPGTGSAVGDRGVFDWGSFIIYDVGNGEGEDFHGVGNKESKDSKQDKMLGVHA